jgi:hypothetical protein
MKLEERMSKLVRRLHFSADEDELHQKMKELNGV